MKSVLQRAGWIFLASLFVITGLGVGVVAFWQAIHPATNNQSQTSQGPNCINDSSVAFNAVGPQAPKLEGAKLADFTPLAHIPALSCTDVKVGTGQAVQSSSKITANYTGAIASTGVIFQSSLDSGQPFSVALNNSNTPVIPAWDQGLLGMKAGGERRLLVPSALAYGASGSCQTIDPKDKTKCDVYAIPPNTDLVFDISVIAVQ